MTDIDKLDDPFNDIKENLDRTIPRATRLLMLDLVLIWARVDTAIGQLSSHMFNLQPSIGAVLFKRMRVPDKIGRLRDLCLHIGSEDGAKHFQHMKKSYEKHSKPRNLVAHAACIGMLKDKSETLVFLPFEAEPKFGHLAIELVTGETIREAVRWGESIEDNAIKTLSETDFWVKHC